MSQPSKIAIFLSTRAVIKADAACKERGIPVRVIAVPPTISSNCGMCLLLTENQLPVFIALMESLTIETKLYDYSPL